MKGEDKMIQKATGKESRVVAGLALLLWPNHTLEDLEEELLEYITSDKAAIFIAYEETEPIGFAQCQLRQDYVEGTESSPVGYLEGVFVKENKRKEGIGKQLVFQCEAWAKAKGCVEFASDCELTNEESLYFHLKMGFEEANRIICFTKKL